MVQIRVQFGMARAQCGLDESAVWHGKGSVWFR